MKLPIILTVCLLSGIVNAPIEKKTNSADPFTSVNRTTTELNKIFSLKQSFASYSVTCQNAYGRPFVIRLLDPVTGAQVYATAVTSGYFSSYTLVPEGIYNVTITAGVPGIYNYRIGSNVQTGVPNASASNVPFPGWSSPFMEIY